jgi:hypothetical protein
MKPILFNTEMVRAILDGRKTTTRRVIKLPDGFSGNPVGNASDENNPLGFMWVGGIKRPTYSVGDILYVRETFAKYNCAENECIMADYSGCNGCTHTKDGYCYVYKSSHEYDVNVKWKPSRFMPKEAARIFLRVTGVRAERLQDITDVWKEGIYPWGLSSNKAEKMWCNYTHKIDPKAGVASNEGEFAAYWDCITPKDKLDTYGWDANPWVWVVEFEKCEKPEGNI